MIHNRIITLLLLLTAAAMTVLGAPTASAQYAELSKTRINEIVGFLPAKPAGFGVPCSNRKAWIGLAADYQGNIGKAEELIAKPLPKWSDDAYLQYSRTGDRLVGEAMIRSRQNQFGPLVLAECSEWKGRFLPRIAELLDEFSRQRSWTLPAHDSKLENYNGTRYYVDLNAADLGHWIAEALYLLGGRLPEATRKRSMAALELHMFAPTRLDGDGGGQDRWLHVHSNWNAVCLNGVTDAALTVLANRNDRALFAAAAEHYIANYFYSYSDSGYDDEGIGYWDYGLSNFEELREQLWLSTKGKLDLYDIPKASKAALFGFQFAMLPGVYADFADAGFMSKPNPALLLAINRVFRLGFYPATAKAPEAAFTGSLPEAVLAGFPNMSGRKAKDQQSSGVAALIGLRTYYADVGVLVDRPAPNGDLAITIKAGGNGAHSHNDVGSFSIGVMHTQIVGDPGGPNFYTSETFSSKRYNSRLMNSFGHPVPSIDDHLQLEATKVIAPVIATNFTPERDSISIDLTKAYDASSLKKLVRTMTYSRNDGESVQIEDNFDLTGPADIEEALPTHGVCHQVDAKTLQFDYEGAHLRVTFDAPQAFTFNQKKIDEYGNHFTRIGVRIHLLESSRIVMHFTMVH